MRLAFAVATAVRPDLLIVDEAMAVGDAYFQHKSIERIRRYQEQGMALLLVSHDPGAILSLCPRAILIDDGQLVCDGAAEAVLDRYNASLSAAGRQSVRTEALDGERTRTVSGSGEASVERIGLFNADSVECDVVSTVETLRLEIDVRIHADIDELVLGYMIKDRLGRVVFGTNTHHLRQPMRDLRAGQLLRLSFSFEALLGPDSYSIATSLHTGDTHHDANFEWRDLALLFQVVNSAHAHFVGTCWIPPTVSLDLD